MAIHRTKKNKTKAHYGFLYKWQPETAGVKGELASAQKREGSRLNKAKKADILAQETKTTTFKKDITKSLLIISLLLILELVIYLALTRFS